MPLTPLNSGSVNVHAGETSVNRSSVSANTRSVRFVQADATRIGLTIYNLSNATLFVDADRRVTVTDFMVCLPPNAYYECPFDSTLEFWGVWDTQAPDGHALIREFTFG